MVHGDGRRFLLVGLGQRDGLGAERARSAAAHALAKELRRRDAQSGEREQYEKLSTREKDILRLIAAGFSAPEIGTQLNISAKTVDTYKQRIQEKIGVSHRSDYVRFAMKLGLLEP